MQHCRKTTPKLQLFKLILQFFSFENIYFYFYFCICVGALRGQKRVADPVKLDLQVMVSAALETNSSPLQDK
jgi:hypothetical protein